MLVVNHLRSMMLSSDMIVMMSIQFTALTFLPYTPCPCLLRRMGNEGKTENEICPTFIHLQRSLFWLPVGFLCWDPLKVLCTYMCFEETEPRLYLADYVVRASCSWPIIGGVGVRYYRPMPLSVVLSLSLSLSLPPPVCVWARACTSIAEERAEEAR